MSQILTEDRLDLHPTSFVAPGAVLVGEVSLAEESSVWFGCVLRADLAPIGVGRASNVQDGCLFHVARGFPVILGDRVSLGHGVVVHGATIEDDCLIGIRATVLNGARIGKGSLVAAGALVPENAVIPPGSLVMGMPGKVVRPVNEAQSELIARTARAYVGYAAAYKTKYGL